MKNAKFTEIFDPHVIYMEWMLHLGLKRSEVLVFALVYGYYRNFHEYYGSIEHSAKWALCGRRTAIDALDSLVKMGYLIKRENSHGAVRRCFYTVDEANVQAAIDRYQCRNDTGTSAETTLDQCKNDTGTSVIFAPYSTNYNTNNTVPPYNLNIKNNSGGGNLSVPECETAPVGNTPEPPPPNLFKIIKDRIRTQGFYPDDIPVLKIMKFIPHPDWFTDKHSVIDFAFQKVREYYADKPKAEQERLFMSALTSWGNIKDEYPVWREKQAKADESRELEHLRKTPPRKCLGCGADLNGGEICGKCGGMHAFSGETLSWELDTPDPDFSLKKSFAQMLQENRGGTRAGSGKGCKDG
jgi:hypothetical protein